MVGKLFVIVLSCATLACAELAPAPTTAPAKMVKPQRSRNSRAVTLPTTSALAPSTSPTTAPTTTALGRKFPTPAELVAKLKQAAEAKKALLKVAYIDLDGPITEKPPEFSFFGSDRGVSLHNLIERMRRAKDDKDVRAVLLTLGDVSMNLAQTQELREVLVETRRAGKRIFVYADGYDTTGFMLASAGTDICLLPGGEIMIPGVGLETMFYKGAMDKLGVQADYIQIGEYKGAQEPYTRTTPSDEMRGELTKLTDAIYEQIVDTISLGRNVSRDSVKQLIDDTILTAGAAKDRGFVDHVIDQDGLREMLKDELGGEIDLANDYGAPKREELDYSNPFTLLSALTKRPEPSTQPAVAIVYADGEIVDGDGEAGLFGGGGVGSQAMRRNFRMALRDDTVKAVVIRIDSPGGSALASEVMWQGVRRLAAKKPVIISIGGMAASGGYYLASAGDYIFADPIGIVGSIGVVGGKFVMKDLFDKIGLTTEKFAKGRNAGLFSSNEPWSDRQRRMVRNWMQQTYDQFTQRVMTTRSGKITDIDKVARGRIFLARDAKELGLVDELGGTESAIAYAANKAGLKPGDYEVRPLPGPRSLSDLFSGDGGDDSEAKLPFQPIVKMTVSPDSILNFLSPQTRQLVSQQIRFAQLLQQRPVVLMAPFVVRVR